jgi:predicted amidohydrolase YtcJ
VTVYRAAHIVTMHPPNPSGRYIALRDGLILGVGDDPAEFDYWGPYALDDRFADQVLVPGFVEAHSHTQEGFFAGLPYVGYFDRPLPEGGSAPGTTTVEGVVARLVEIERAMTDPEEALLAWGFDPIYFAGTRFSRADLDRVSSTRPVFVLHASGHLATVNSALLSAQGVTAATQTPRVAKDEQGEPTGELQETAILLAGPVAARIMHAAGTESTWWDFGRARSPGCGHLDHQLGSLEAGKLADFTVLGANPLEVDPMAIREIPVRGTVVGGLVYQAPGEH